MAPVTITEITDPFCTWCWGAEPILRRVEETYQEQVEFEFVMGGLVEDFETFRDVANDITEPRDVAPHWEEAAEHHGMPVDPDVWRENPPQSSYPANVAYEAAALQNEELALRYLRRLREAVTVERRDISQESVLLELAGEVGFDPSTFADNFQSEEAKKRFEADRQFVRESRATAFPSFRIEANGEETWINGFQSFDTFRDALEQVASGLEEYDPRPIPQFVEYHDRVATREVAEVYELSMGRTLEVLRSLQDENVVSATSVRNGYFWSVSEDSDDGDPPEESSMREILQPEGRCSLDGDCTPGT